MRKLPVVTGVFIAGALAVAACSGTATPTLPAVNVPTLPPINLPTLPPVNLPTLPPINLPTLPPLGSFAIPSFAIPSFSIPSFAIPSFDANADPALAAKFPTTINGSPVTNVTTYNLVQFMTAISQANPNSAQQLQQLVTVLQGAGMNPSTLAFGNADVTINGEDQGIGAFHVPGGSATTLLSLFPQLYALQNDRETPPTIAQANVGGKAVTTVSEAGSDTVDYLYPSGDVLWDINSSDPQAAATILAALQ
jgi:hypothetical protein